MLELTLTGWEEIPPIHPPLSSLTAGDGEKAIAVFVRWKGLDHYVELDRQMFVDSFLESRVRLRDEDGFEYEALNAMTREQYRFSESPLLAPRDWVVVFHTPVNSSGHTFLVNHPNPGQSEFDVAMVTLE